MRTSEISPLSPDVEIRQETDTRPEPEIDNPAEVQVSMSAICEEGLDATRPYIPETASQFVTADRPETTVFPVAASQEIVVESNPNYATSPNPTVPSTPHTWRLNYLLVSPKRPIPHSAS